MKTAWSAVSFLAVVHLLALLMLIGWLWQTDRLDGRRLEDLRAMFSRTVIEDRTAAEAAARDAEMLSQLAEEEAMRRDPSRSSAEVIQVVSQTKEEAKQSLRRLQDTREELLAQIADATAKLEAQRAALTADQQNWRQAAETDRQRQAREQLAKSVKLLESLPPKQAKRKIVELIDGGNMPQAVAYLNQMNQRAAGKVLAEFKTDQENKLATELLEQLRTYGLGAGADRDSTDADAVASSG